MYIDFYIEELSKDKFQLKEGDNGNKVIGLTFELNTFNDADTPSHPVTLWVNMPSYEYNKNDIQFLINKLQTAINILEIVKIRKDSDISLDKERG